MTHILGALAVVLLLGTVLARVAALRLRGIEPTKFGAVDKTDFVIVPFAILYIYLIVARALNWPSVVHSVLFISTAASWAGVTLCAVALGVMTATLSAFGSSFRIGIDMDRPDKLVTTGVFGVSRNPIYVAFAMMLAGEFLISPTWLLLLYFLAGTALFHRQVLREEAFLGLHYGSEYQSYMNRVRRYL